MDPACLRHTEVPQTTALFADFLYRFERVAAWYDHWHLDADSFRRAAGQIVFPEDRRAVLVAALRKRNGDSKMLDLLARPGTVAVVTGQQVGLFSDPCYTLYKALTAVRLAAELSARGIPAVPVFWLATEDHDFDEVNHCRSFDAGQQPLLLSIDAAGEERVPVGSLTPARYPVEELRASLGDFPFGGEVASMVEEGYRPGRALGEAFEELLRRLLGGHRLLLVDPLQPEIRALAAPLLRRAVDAAADVAPLVENRNKELQEAGYHAQVHWEAKSSLFFLLAGGRRLTLRRDGDTYWSDQRRLSAQDLAAEAENLSANALLRPVVQDYLLPTAAYVGGPAEIAYLAQSQVLYRAFLQRAPVVVPRAAFTLLDARAAKLMERYSLRVADCFHGLEELRSRIAARLIPAGLEQALTAAREKVKYVVDGLDPELRGFDSTLAAALAKSRAKVLYQLSKIEGKTAREALRRDERAGAEAAHLSRLIYPDKHLQERYYTILPFLARHGLDLIDRLYHNVRLDCPDHVVLAV